MHLICKAPKACDEAELAGFLSLVGEAAEVTSQGFERRVRRAHWLCFATSGTSVLGVGALKAPLVSYRRRIFREAAAESDASDFTEELGWLAVAAESRGQGVGGRITAELKKRMSGAVFATTREDNTAMIGLLQRHGFRRDGRAYLGRGSTPLQLYVWV